MTILFSSAFQVQYPAEGQMVIIDPPTLWVALVWYVVALLGLMAFLRKPETRNLLSMAGGILFLGCGLCGWEYSHSSSAALDKGAGTFTLHSPWPRGDYIRPLSELKSATVETAQGAYRLVFVLEGGHREGLGPYSDQSGQPEAAFAINHFLGVEKSSTPENIQKSPQPSSVERTTIHFNGQDMTFTLADTQQLQQALQTYLDVHKNDRPPNILQGLPERVGEAQIDSGGNIEMAPWQLVVRDTELVLACRMTTVKDQAGNQFVAHFSNAGHQWLVSSIEYVKLFDSWASPN